MHPSERPFLLLLPGLLCDAELWRSQINALADRAEIKVADLTRHDSIPELARAALEGVPERFMLAGLSMGGYVAMEIMRMAPERVERLALLDTTARPDTPEQLRRRRGLIELARRGDFKGVTPRLLPMLLAPAHLDNAALTQSVMDMAQRVGKDAFLRQQTAILGRIDSRPSLEKIKIPVTLICGAEDALTPPEHMHEMAELIGPRAAAHVLEGAGHLPTLETPEKVNAILREMVTD